MSKQDNLKDYLTDLYEGIALRNPSASRNPQDFRTAIENIEGGDGAPLYDGTIEIDGQPADDYTDYYEKGLEDGESIGRQAQYDEFWENYLAEAKATGIGAMIFAGCGWNVKTFNPPYKIDFITNGFQMFAYAGNIPKDKLAMVDYSKITTNFNQLFTYSNITELPRIDTRGSSDVLSVFGGAYSLTTIEALVLREDGSQTINDTCFANCLALENLIIEGTIGQAVLDLHWSTKLSKASITSIINALSSTTSGLAVTLSQTAVNAAFETESGAADGSTSDEWINLVASKTNWTISLA